MSSLAVLVVFSVKEKIVVENVVGCPVAGAVFDVEVEVEVLYAAAAAGFSDEKCCRHHYYLKTPSSLPIPTCLAHHQ